MPLPNIPVLGVRFDIDGLQRHSAGNYAETAWTIVWQALDPALIGGASLWHGDTAATLDRHENVFCIAIQHDDAACLKRAQSILAASSDLNSVAAIPPFAEGNYVSREPLPGDGHVDGKGDITGQSFHARPALLRARPAKPAGTVSEPSPSETAHQEAAETIADAPTSPVQAWLEAAPPSPAVDPNAPAAPELTLRKLLFSFDGRIGNGAYLAGVLLPIAALLASGFIISPIVLLFQAVLGPVQRGSALDVFSGVVGVGLLIVFCFLWLWSKLAVAVKRWHDMNLSGAMVLLLLIPYLNLLIIVWLLFGPGTQGPNRWGNTMRMRQRRAAELSP